MLERDVVIRLTNFQKDSVFLPRTRLGSFSIDDGTATTTPQIKNLMGRVRKNERAARAARTNE